MRRQSIFVAATGASVLMIALVSAATAYVVMNHEEKARVVGGLTIDDGTAEETDDDRSLILRMADALADRLFDGWGGSQTAQIAGSGSAGTGGSGSVGGGVAYGASLSDLFGESGSFGSEGGGWKFQNMAFSSGGNGGLNPSAGFGGSFGGGGSSGYSGGGSGGAGGGGGTGTGGTGGNGGSDGTGGGDDGRLTLPDPFTGDDGDTGSDPVGDDIAEVLPFTPIAAATPVERLDDDGEGGIAQVPEPGTLATLGGSLSLIAMGMAWRRRRQ